MKGEKTRALVINELRREIVKVGWKGWEGAGSRVIRKPENLPECASP